MVNENYKFVPKVPETFIVAELKEQEIKKSPLSAAAQSKVIRKWGGNYVSENRDSYGPCYNKDDCKHTFFLTLAGNMKRKDGDKICQTDMQNIERAKITLDQLYTGRLYFNTWSSETNKEKKKAAEKSIEMWIKHFEDGNSVKYTINLD